MPASSRRHPPAISGWSAPVAGSAPAMAEATGSIGPAFEESARAWDRPPTRLTLRSGESGWLVDGGWWPRSDDLAAELPDLVRDLAARGFDVVAGAYNVTTWTRPPRQVDVGHRWVKLVGYRTQDPSVLSLDDLDGRRLDLVVVPAITDPAVAERALVLAAGADGRSPQTLGPSDAEALLAQARHDVPSVPPAPSTVEHRPRRRTHLT
jgi:hypothetical protein